MKRLLHILLLLLSVSLPLQVLADYAPCQFDHQGDPAMGQMHHASGAKHACCPDDHQKGKQSCHCHDLGHVPAMLPALPQTAVVPVHERLILELPAWVSLTYPPLTPPDNA